MLLRAFLGFCCVLALGACQKKKARSSGPTLPAYCSQSYTYNQDPVQITVHAQYDYRLSEDGTKSSTPRPIRHAEVRVINASGQTVQCGHTDSSGNITFTLDRSSTQTYVYVNSRADNEHLKAYVMTDPSSLQYYSVSTGFVPSSTQTLPNLTASVEGSIEGGAFNILDQIMKANEYLIAQTANCASIRSSCVPFTVSQTLLTKVFWKKGVSPAQAYYNSSSAVSFYIPGTQQLFILGGEDGDVDYSDSDHFDNSVIVHEYGHYIEDLFIGSDSPGGAHNGNSIIDPRLAWSEGFADFFQAAVSGVPVYMDSEGTADGSHRILIEEYLESYNSRSPSRDLVSTSTAGEGNFREFSVARLQWQVQKNSNGFSELWALLTPQSSGFRSFSSSFRSIGVLHEIQTALNYSNWSTYRTSEKQLANRKDFANPLQNGTCNFTLADTDSSDVNTSDPYQRSNLFASNDFYAFYHSGGALNITLNYSTSSARGSDLDLYVYKYDFTFGETADQVGSSEKTVNDPTYSTETISKSSVAAGTYMINVKLFTGPNSPRASGFPMQTATYQLSINGVQKCATF